MQNNSFLWTLDRKPRARMWPQKARDNNSYVRPPRNIARSESVLTVIRHYTITLHDLHSAMRYNGEKNRYLDDWGLPSFPILVGIVATDNSTAIAYWRTSLS
jgi:hypothetical protein